MRRAVKQPKSVRILFTCVGRRVELLRAFRNAADALKVMLEIHGADATPFSPAIHFVDRAHIVPTIASGRYVEALSKIVRREKIDLLIPLIDSDLPILSESVERFRRLNCLALVSSPDVIDTCRDKMRTYEALTRAGLDTPHTWTWRASLKRRGLSFPLYLKPRRGSAAKGNYVVRNREELNVFGRRVPDAIVQEFVEGVEHTIDVYTGLDGHPRCAVPRRRLEVRTGEVSKGLVVKDSALMQTALRVAEVLSGCLGVVTVQCILTSGGRIRVIEINPRFGGGAPLAIHAGADFPRWILEEFLGRPPSIDASAFRDDVAMLRYDESVFVENASQAVDFASPAIKR